MEMINRPRRLRTSANLRKMVRETRMDKSSLIYPMFIVEGTNIKEEIPSMMGQYRYSVDRMGEKLEELTKAGIGATTSKSGYFNMQATKVGDDTTLAQIVRLVDEAAVQSA